MGTSAPASHVVKRLAEGREPWALLWIFKQPTEPGAALAQVEAWLSSPSRDFSRFPGLRVRNPLIEPS
jgi:hypothetical protein